MRGFIRSVLRYEAFADVGCECDTFLHKSTLEEAYKNRVIFDVANSLEVGARFDLVVSLRTRRPTNWRWPSSWTRPTWRPSSWKQPADAAMINMYDVSTCAIMR